MTEARPDADAARKFAKGVGMATFGSMLYQMWNMAPECPACGKPQGMDTDCLTCVFHPSWRSSPFIPPEHPNHP